MKTRIYAAPAVKGLKGKCQQEDQVGHRVKPFTYRSMWSWCPVGAVASRCSTSRLRPRWERSRARWHCPEWGTRTWDRSPRHPPCHPGTESRKSHLLSTLIGLNGTKKDIYFSIAVHLCDNLIHLGSAFQSCSTKYPWHSPTLDV